MWRELLSGLDSPYEYVFRSPASMEQILAVEARLGVTFTDELRHFYLETDGLDVQSELYKSNDVHSLEILEKSTNWFRENHLRFGKLAEVEWFFCIFLSGYEDDSRVPEGGEYLTYVIYVLPQADFLRPGVYHWDASVGIDHQFRYIALNLQNYYLGLEEGFVFPSDPYESRSESVPPREHGD